MLCSKQHTTAQDTRPYILTLKGFGYGHGYDGYDGDDDDDRSCSTKVFLNISKVFHL